MYFDEILHIYYKNIGVSCNKITPPVLQTRNQDTQNPKIRASIADDVVVIIIIQSITTGNLGRIACKGHVVESDVQ